MLCCGGVICFEDHHPPSSTQVLDHCFRTLALLLHVDVVEDGMGVKEMSHSRDKLRTVLTQLMQLDAEYKMLMNYSIAQLNLIARAQWPESGIAKRAAERKPAQSNAPLQRNILGDSRGWGGQPKVWLHFNRCTHHLFEVCDPPAWAADVQ
eukprot:5140920-Amphidinium_carterae.1